MDAKKECPECGNVVDRASSRAIYCSERCRVKKTRRNRAAQKKAGARARETLIARTDPMMILKVVQVMIKNDRPMTAYQIGKRLGLPFGKRALTAESVLSSLIGEGLTEGQVRISKHQSGFNQYAIV